MEFGRFGDGIWDFYTMGENYKMVSSKTPCLPSSVSMSVMLTIYHPNAICSVTKTSTSSVADHQMLQNPSFFPFALVPFS